MVQRSALCTFTQESYEHRKVHLPDHRTHTVCTSAVRMAGGRRQWNLTPASPKVIYDEESLKKGLYKLFYAPSDLLLLFFSSTKGFSMLIKCRRDIAPQCAHYKRQSRGRIWMILTDSWLNLGL